MKLADVVNGPWAITPAMHSEIQGIYARHCRGDKIDLVALEARMGAPLPGPTKGYTVDSGVAIIPVDGVLAKRANLFTMISGGTSMQLLASDIQEALDDPSVTSIILNVDSPGGTVDGTQELANQILAARGQKPIIALADGMMCSAAYWIASAADQIFVSSDTALVGSIGVVAQHQDVSTQENQRGVKTTEITAGKYKRIASQYAPLSTEGLKSIQDQVDYTYSIFVNDVARNRGSTPETVIENMADGRTFLGQQAVQAGLVDGVATLAELVERASSGDFDKSAPGANGGRGAGALQAAEQNPLLNATGKPAATDADKPDSPIGAQKMDVSTLKAEHPAVAQALIDEGRAAGAAAECERIKAVEEQHMAGHDALIATLKFDGKTTGPQAAVQVLAAEKKKGGDRLAALRDDAGKASVKNAPMPEDDEDPDDEETKKAKKADKAGASINPHAVAAAAQEYQRQEARAGRKVSAAQAVYHVQQAAAK